MWQRGGGAPLVTRCSGRPPYLSLHPSTLEDAHALRPLLLPGPHEAAVVNGFQAIFERFLSSGGPCAARNQDLIPWEFKLASRINQDSGRRYPVQPSLAATLLIV